MKFYKLNANSEFPGITEGDGFTSALISATERIDIRPGETVVLGTGLRMEYSARMESLTMLSPLEHCVVEGFTSMPGEEMTISISNRGSRNVPVYPGRVIAYLTAARKMSLRATLRAVEETNNAAVQN